MASEGIDVALLTVGKELPWLTGYEAMPLERITCLVLTAEEARLVVPRLEAARVRPLDGLELLPWADGTDPFGVIASMLGASAKVAVDDRCLAGWLLALQERRPRARFVSATALVAPLRARKDALELELLERAARAADRVAEAVRGGAIEVRGRTELEVARAIGQALLDEGHHRVSFAIVASGPNSASPHHEPTNRRIGPGDVLVLDFGGAYSVDGEPGYGSDITRTFVVGDPPAGFGELYAVLARAQEEARLGIRAGMRGAEADALARSTIAQGGYGKHFIHRLGHGIGLEEHEDPYLAEGSAWVLESGMTFSVEPGIYLEGRFGARIEDIVALTDDGVVSLNRAPRDLGVIEA
jgi:Xaa-Pro aminopeptidase